MRLHAYQRAVPQIIHTCDLHASRNWLPGGCFTTPLVIAVTQCMLLNFAACSEATAALPARTYNTAVDNCSW